MTDVIVEIEEPMYPDEYVMSDEQLAVYVDQPNKIRDPRDGYVERLVAAKEACAKVLTAEKEHVCYRLEAGQRIRALYEVTVKTKQEVADDLGYSVAWIRALANCTPESVGKAQADNAQANKEYRARQRLKAEAAAAEANRKLAEAQEAAAKAKKEAAEAKAKLALSRDSGRKPEPAVTGNDVDNDTSAADRKGAYADPIAEQEEKSELNPTGNGGEPKYADAQPVQERKLNPKQLRLLQEFLHLGNQLVDMDVIESYAWEVFTAVFDDIDLNLTGDQTTEKVVADVACSKRGGKKAKASKQHKLAA